MIQDGDFLHLSKGRSKVSLLLFVHFGHEIIYLKQKMMKRKGEAKPPLSIQLVLELLASKVEESMEVDLFALQTIGIVCFHDEFDIALSISFDSRGIDRVCNLLNGGNHVVEVNLLPRVKGTEHQGIEEVPTTIGIATCLVLDFLDIVCVAGHVVEDGVDANHLVSGNDKVALNPILLGEATLMENHLDYDFLSKLSIILLLHSLKESVVGIALCSVALIELARAPVLAVLIDEHDILNGCPSEDKHRNWNLDTSLADDVNDGLDSMLTIYDFTLIIDGNEGTWGISLLKDGLLDFPDIFLNEGAIAHKMLENGVIGNVVDFASFSNIWIVNERGGNGIGVGVI